MKILELLKDRLRSRGKILFSTIAATLLLFLGSTQYTHADVISDIAYGAVSSVCFLIAYVISWIAGVFIAIEAWFIGIVLNINAGVFSTSFVQTGFSISLSVANLAFVLGIIVIAIATILRIENYSIKKMLWKLVVMAILVNFGLVIIAPIYGFSNATTQYFMNAIAPSTSSGMSSFNSFATTMVQRFSPGTVIQSASNVSSNTCATGSSCNTGALGSIGTGPMSPKDTGQGVVGAMMIPIFDLAFTIVDLALIVFVLAAFFVMLMIRYIYIAILAILLPFAWASWVFPSFSSMYSKWWNKFLQWTFFAPIFMFFLYLALATTGGSNPSDAFNATATYTTSDTVFGSIVSFFGNSITVILSNFLNEMILAGLILGGLVAADSMGIKFANSTVSFAQKQGKRAGSAAWNATKRRTTDRLRAAGKKTTTNASGQTETTTFLQRAGSRLQGIPVPFSKTIGSAVAKKGSEPIFHEERAEDIKKYAESKLRGLDNQGLIDRANSSTAFINPTEAAAIAQELSKRDLTASIDPTRMKRFIGNSERMGNVQSILNNRPELAAQTSAATPRLNAITGVMETQAEAMARAIGDATKKIKTADITDINYKSMGDPTNPNALPTANQYSVVMNMSPGQLRKLVTDGSDNQAKAFKNSIESLFNGSQAPGAAPLPAAQQAKLAALHHHMTNNPDWAVV